MKSTKSKTHKEDKIERVDDMPVYRLFYELALDVEKTTCKYSPDFRWLRDQSLRSSESVCANMTEGFYNHQPLTILQTTINHWERGKR